MVILTMLMVPMYYIHVPATFSTNPFHRLEDAIDAFRQMKYDPLICVALSATIIRFVLLFYSPKKIILKFLFIFLVSHFSTLLASVSRRSCRRRHVWYSTVFVH